MKYKEYNKMSDNPKDDEANTLRGVFIRPLGKIYDFYLTGYIEGPEEYQEWNQLLRTTSEHDIIYLHINCYGGQALTAVQLMRSISESNAKVIASVEGACMSAATFIFLMADMCELSEHSIFMFHNFSGGAIGKGNEMIAQVQHNEKWGKHLLNSLYKGFFTPEEIASIIEGKDYWLTADDVSKRLERRNADNKKVKKSPSPKNKPLKTVLKNKNKVKLPPE
jgi:ATP-dependent Clp protease protease subunit